MGAPSSRVQAGPCQRPDPWSGKDGGPPATRGSEEVEAVEEGREREGSPGGAGAEAAAGAGAGAAAGAGAGAGAGEGAGPAGPVRDTEPAGEEEGPKPSVETKSSLSTARCELESSDCSSAFNSPSLREQQTCFIANAVADTNHSSDTDK